MSDIIREPYVITGRAGEIVWVPRLYIPGISAPPGHPVPKVKAHLILKSHPTPMATVENQEAEPPSHKYKSFKKKWMKERAKFAVVMEENNKLWEQEQRMQRISNRLEEELDQLRELLLDVNEAEDGAPHLKVNIRPADPEEAAFLRKMGLDDDGTDDDDEDPAGTFTPESARLVLKEIKVELKEGRITQADFDNLYRSILPYLRKGISLAYLERTVPHTKLKDLVDKKIPLPSDLVKENPVGYLTYEREAEYLDRLDAEYDSTFPSDPQGRSSYNRPLNAARDNPNSALNWLRKNQPQVFLQDTELQEKAQDAKQSGAAGSSKDTPAKREGGRAKRGSVAQEVLDEEGYIVGGVATENGGTIKGKRKRGGGNDDGAYHGKTGGSARKKTKLSMGGDVEMD